MPPLGTDHSIAAVLLNYEALHDVCWLEGDALKVNASLSALDLESNSIRADGAGALDLDSNSIRADGAGLLADALKVNAILY